MKRYLLFCAYDEASRPIDTLRGDFDFITEALDWITTHARGWDTIELLDTKTRKRYEFSKETNKFRDMGVLNYEA